MPSRASTLPEVALRTVDGLSANLVDMLALEATSTLFSGFITNRLARFRRSTPSLAERGVVPSLWAADPARWKSAAALPCALLNVATLHARDSGH